jgi:inner membrane protein
MATIEAAGGGARPAGLSWLPTRSYGLKLLLVCALALAMTVPALFVFVVSADRQGRHYEVLNEVGQLRGGSQSLAGPVVVAPYRPVVTAADGTLTQATQDSYYVVHASSGRASARLDSEELRRSIYRVPVYQATVDFSAEFDLASARPGAAALGVDWSRAQIVLAASDLRGAREAATVRLDGGQPLELEPATSVGEMAGGQQAMSVPLANAASRDRLDVEAHLVFSGSQRFALLPFAKATEAEVTADWPHPSFNGGFLPDTRDVRDDGFDAAWSVPFLARGAPGAGTAYEAGFAALVYRDLGVTLIQPLDVYASVGRALKYALMFVGFVFLAYFLFEVASGAQMHPAQYVLVGLAQATFYLLLLAAAEHVGFTPAFLIAAGLTVTAISLYAGSVYRSSRYGVVAFVVFSLVYALLFMLMRLQDYALVMGALATFAALATAMAMTRRVDWYGGGAKAPERAAR